MNTNTSRIAQLTRPAACLLAFGSLLAGSQAAARADVVIDRFLGPSQIAGVSADNPYMLFHVRNTAFSFVNATRVSTGLYYNNALVAAPASSPFNLAPLESKWVNVAIPARSTTGMSLLNLSLLVAANVGRNSYVYSFINQPYTAPTTSNVQSGDVTFVRQNADQSKVFTVAFTNKGNGASQPISINVATWQYADGQISPTLTQTATLPALQPGQSTLLTFTTQPTDGYDIKGYVQIGTGNSVNFSL